MPRISCGRLNKADTHNYQYYGVIIGQLLTCQPFLINSEEVRKGEFDKNVYEYMMEMLKDLVETMEREASLEGTLLRTAMEDNIVGEIYSGDVRLMLNAAEEGIHTLTDVIACQFEINEVLHWLCKKGDPALDTDGAFLKDMRLTEVAGMSNPLAGYYHFRSTEVYYRFLLLRMIENGSRVARCEWCGRFFVPRTNAATKYCDRVIRDGKTCKDIAPVLKHKLQTERNKVVGTFDRVKRKLYKRYERALAGNKKPSPKDLSIKEYYAWLDEATKARDDYLAGTLAAEQALAIIEAEPVRGDAAR